MDVIDTDIEDVFLLRPRRHADERGSFAELFRQDVFANRAGDIRFVQDNHSLSIAKGTVRGLHFQAPPSAQAKLVRASRGAVFDVVVDIRVGSPSYGRHVAVELSAENELQLFAPAGFLHGFCTLTAHAEVVYKVSAHYDAAADGGVAFDDPDLSIRWPTTRREAVLSAKDARLPRLADLSNPFRFIARAGRTRPDGGPA